MTQLSISNLSVQSSLTTTLQAEQASLTLLSSQLSSQKKYTDLTDYSAADARNLISLQSSATQKQAYLSVIGTVNTNLSIYDTTLTDLETITSQAGSLANNNPTFDASTASNVAVEATNYLRSVGVDLNQQINGRYIYAGTRYTQQPVADLSDLPTSTLSSTIQTDGTTLPSYDTDSTLTATTSGQTVTIDGTVTAGQVASVTVNGTAYSYTATATDTPTTIAAGLASAISAGGVATTSAGGVLTVAAGATISASSATTPSTTAYATDTATIDSNFTVNYGLSSDNPAFQTLIAGLRYLQAAGNSTDAATYQSNMTQASNLLSQALTAIQNVHTGVANNINIMSSEQTSQTAAISSLTDQVDNIQQVDLTQVSTEITAMQTILQASYAVTGDIEKMSIVSYL